MPRTAAVLCAFAAFAAFAQTPDVLTPPPIVVPPDAAPLTECKTNQDCERSATCTFQSLGDGKWSSRGLCVDPRTSPSDPIGLRKRTPDEPDRFQFRDSVPEGFHLVSRPRWTLVGGGIGALAGGYLFAALIGWAGNSALGTIPVLGSIFLGAEWWATGSFAGVANFFIVLFCGVDVLAQVAGIVMIAVGLGNPQRWLERDAARPSITLVPGAAGSPLGASLVGRF